MIQVWKFPLPGGRIAYQEFELGLPQNAATLCVQVQQGSPYLWAMVSTEGNVEPSKRTFLLVGTGHDFDDRYYSYIGTFQTHEGSYVGHVFEVLG